ncbi:MAG: ATP-binding protein [Tyzzerella sp.]|uniref:ATP-binding protein n=1 Tax=Candidatus Fimicola merdigallinarum TaxID=2840819 RepID=A0A9D9DYT4_9FIRM|nr:ATP-binding protein [Candidatus Fimicola merdigallinarum]
MASLREIKSEIYSLVVFRNILKDTVVNSFLDMVDTIEKGDIAENIKAYSDFVSKLFENNINFSDYILNIVLEDENVYMLEKAQNNIVDDMIEKCLLNELKVLEKLSNISSEDIKKYIGYKGFLADYKTSNYDFVGIYKERIRNINSHGYGIFAKYQSFMIKGEGGNVSIVPVKNPDKTRLSQLGGYERERKAVIDNTKALLRGKPSANVLLYGDSGTGKSSSVKAIANEFAKDGLRLIELRKNQLRFMPELLDTLSLNPLKFILFIDDLSFTQNDDDFASLKAILEGSVSSKANNLAIYATSNRRHLVKESFGDRDGNDLHINDTIQELVSLSERFGLTVTFEKPDKQKYLEVVSGLADYYHIDMDRDELFKLAESYAVRRNGRSARVAKQFIEMIKAKE